MEAACTGKHCGPVVVIQLVAHHGGGVHGKNWWTYGGQTTSCSSLRRRVRAKTGGPVVVRLLVAHHGGVHGQRLVDLWWSDC